MDIWIRNPCTAAEGAAFADKESHGDPHYIYIPYSDEDINCGQKVTISGDVPTGMSGCPIAYALTAVSDADVLALTTPWEDSFDTETGTLTFADGNEVVGLSSSFTCVPTSPDPRNDFSSLSNSPVVTWRDGCHNAGMSLDYSGNTDTAKWTQTETDDTREYSMTAWTTSPDTTCVLDFDYSISSYGDYPVPTTFSFDKSDLTALKFTMSATDLNAVDFSIYDDY